MLPVVVAGGLLIALSFVFGIQAAQGEGSLADGPDAEWPGGLRADGPRAGRLVAFSIADRPGLTPGLCGGMLAVQLKAGFLGGISRAFSPATSPGGCGTPSSCLGTSRA